MTPPQGCDLLLSQRGIELENGRDVPAICGESRNAAEATTGSKKCQGWKDQMTMTEDKSTDARGSLTAGEGGQPAVNPWPVKTRTLY